jgi:hypothetical protein
MEQADRTNYEQNDPDHPTEEEVIDRANQRLDEALGNVDEAKERMARNAGRRGGSGSGPPPQ